MTRPGNSPRPPAESAADALTGDPGGIDATDSSWASGGLGELIEGPDDSHDADRLSGERRDHSAAGGEPTDATALGESVADPLAFGGSLSYDVASVGPADQSAAADDSGGGSNRDETQLPETLGGYLIGRRLGRGGMGDVFLAEHRSMGRQVAMKVLQPQWLRRAGGIDRFYEEVRAASRLLHPNIVTAFDAGEAAGVHYLAMEYVPGQTLTQIINQSGVMSVPEAASVIRQTAFALQHAHAAGVIHRDVKPSNVMRTAGGTVKLLDLGLARIHPLGHAPLTVLRRRDRTSQPDDPSGETDADGDSRWGRKLLGTLAFMSPEQLENPNSADARSDQYSLGAMFFYLLVGQPPFTGQTIDLVYGHRHAEPPHLMSLRPDVDLTLANIVRRMMAKNPSERYGSIDEVAAVLQRYHDRPIPNNPLSLPAAIAGSPDAGAGRSGWTSGVSTSVSTSLIGGARVTGRGSEDSTRISNPPTDASWLVSSAGDTRGAPGGQRIVGIELGVMHAASYTDAAAIVQSLPEPDRSPGSRSLSNPYPATARRPTWRGAAIRMAIASHATGERARRAGRGELLFGEPAYAFRTKQPERLSHCQLLYLGRDEATRRLAGRDCPPEVALAMCLRRLMLDTIASRDAATPVAGWDRDPRWPTLVAITVPSGYDQLHRRALQSAARLAGFPEIRLIDRGVALSAAAGLSGNSSDKTTDHSTDEGESRETVRLSVSLTNQALDVSVLARRGGRWVQIATGGSSSLAVMAYQGRMVDLLSKRAPGVPRRHEMFGNASRRDQAVHLQIAAEIAVTNLLLQPRTTVTIPAARAEDGRPEAAPTVLQVDREDWLGECENLLRSCHATIEATLRRAGLSWSQVDRCMILGSLLKIPQVRSRILRDLPGNCTVEVLNRRDAARGASLAATAEAFHVPGQPLPTQTIGSHSIGIVVADRTGRRRILPIINDAAPLPVRNNRQLTGLAGERTMTLSLVESSSRITGGWRTLGRHVIELPPAEEKTPEASTSRQLGFEMDLNGLLSIYIRRPDLDRTVRMPPLPALPTDRLDVEDWRAWIETTVR